MKRAFTLLEMMIVVALIATMMTIVLRLSASNDESTARTKTVLRLSQLENCLSGYFAAYGSYPPVALHNTRDIYQEADSFGVQSTGEVNENIWSWNVKTFLSDMKSGSGSSQEEERKAWNQVKAACEAQPVALESPAPYMSNGGMDDAIQSLVRVVQQNSASGDYPNYPKDEHDKNYYAWKNGFDSLSDNLGRMSAYQDDISWRKVQVCKFGLMSFLLPRYQAMMGWRADAMFSGGDCIFEQWNANNGAAPRDPFTGLERDWQDINAKVIQANGANSGSDSEMRKARAYLESIPSEAATARWLPNLAGACACDLTGLEFFGVTLNASDSGGMFNVSSEKSAKPPDISVYSPGSQGGARGLYVLPKITVTDGWGTEFFYYSAAPYQSYVLWSAGKNMRTFPPWISRKNLSSKANECVFAWTEDDIRGMSN